MIKMNKHSDSAVSRLIASAHGIEKSERYRLQAHTGRSLEVYDTYIIISSVQAGSRTSNTLNRINIADIFAIQFKEPSGTSAGLIQFSYSGGTDGKAGAAAAVNGENSIPVSLQNLELAREIVNYLEKRHSELRNGV